MKAKHSCKRNYGKTDALADAGILYIPKHAKEQEDEKN